MQHDKASEGIVPMLYDVRVLDKKAIPEFGSFRPMFIEAEGGYKMTYDEEKLCKLVVPFQVCSGRSLIILFSRPLHLWSTA